MRGWLHTAILIALLTVAAGCTWQPGQNRGAATGSSLGARSTAAPSPTAAPFAVAEPAAAINGTPCSACMPACPRYSAAERQQWVDELRRSGPPLAEIREDYDTSFTDYFHGDAFLRVNLAQVVAQADLIVVAHVTSQELDATWSTYTKRFVPAGMYFGVAGRSQLAVDAVLKGDAADFSAFGTLPFFVAADAECQPLISLGSTIPTLILPVFAGEHAVIFIGHNFYYPGTRGLLAVIPIDAQGNAGRPPSVYRYQSDLSTPGMTGQQLVDAVRAAVTAPTATPGR